MNEKTGIFIFGIIGIGLLFLLMKSKPGTFASRPIQRSYAPLKLSPARRYQNAETWDIKWNADGLPSQVTIHRDATQS